MLPFAIVDFLDVGDVAVVPCKWFTGPEEDACYWPPGRVNISKAVKDEVVPNSDWPQFKVRILGKAGHVFIECGMVIVIMIIMCQITHK